LIGSMTLSHALGGEWIGARRGIIAPLLMVQTVAA